MDLDLGQLLRFKGMVDAAATAVEPDGAGAHALTDSYMRLRDQIGTVLEGELSDEFNASFPEVKIIEPQPAPRVVMANLSESRRARALLAQLAGWLDGLIQERTLEQRMRIEAQERAKLEQRKPPGFS